MARHISGHPVFLLNAETVRTVLGWTVFNVWLLIPLPFIVIFAAGQPVSSPAGKGVLAYVCTVVGLRLVAHLTRIILSPVRWFLRPPKVNWTDQLVVVTGGASGLGAVLVERLAKLGARVAVMDIREGTFDDVYADRIQSFLCDVSSSTAVSTTANAIRSSMGNPTMLVNNAGITKAKLLLDLTEKDVMQSLGVNYVGHYWTVQQFLPAMLERGRGHILTVSSVMGIIGCARMVDYCSTKAACLAFHEALQFELASQYCSPRVYTSVLLPSLIQGPMFSTSTLSANWLFRFMSPVLLQEQVVDQILQALEEEESKTIMMPSYVHLTPLIRWVPGLRQLAQWMTGADHAYDTFHDSKAPAGTGYVDSPAPSAVDQRD